VKKEGKKMSVNSAPQAHSGVQADASRHAQNSDALALELIDLLGVDGARRMCREYCWDGVATAIERVSTPDNTAA
jgi:hypothetical protein